MLCRLMLINIACVESGVDDNIALAEPLFMGSLNLILLIHLKKTFTPIHLPLPITLLTGNAKPLGYAPYVGDGTAVVSTVSPVHESPSSAQNQH